MGNSGLSQPTLSDPQQWEFLPEFSAVYQLHFDHALWSTMLHVISFFRARFSIVLLDIWQYFWSLISATLTLDALPIHSPSKIPMIIDYTVDIKPTLKRVKPLKPWPNRIGVHRNTVNYSVGTEEESGNGVEPVGYVKITMGYQLTFGVARNSKYGWEKSKNLNLMKNTNEIRSYVRPFISFENSIQIGRSLTNKTKIRNFAVPTCDSGVAQFQNQAPSYHL